MKSYAFDFVVAQNSNHVYLEFNFCSNSNSSAKRHVISISCKNKRQMDYSNFEPLQNQMHMTSRETCLTR